MDLRCEAQYLKQHVWVASKRPKAGKLVVESGWKLLFQRNQANSYTVGGLSPGWRFCAHQQTGTIPSCSSFLIWLPLHPPAENGAFILQYPLASISITYKIYGVTTSRISKRTLCLHRRMICALQVCQRPEGFPLYTRYCSPVALTVSALPGKTCDKSCENSWSEAHYSEALTCPDYS